MSYCRPLLKLQQSADPISLSPSFAEWTSKCIGGSLAESFNDLLTFANAFLKEKGISHYWVALRATKTNRDYDQPRWHSDDDFYAPDEPANRVAPLACLRPLIQPKSTDFKIVTTTLLSPPTLFIWQSDQAAARQAQTFSKQLAATSVRCLGCATAAESVRQSLVKDLDRMSSVQAGPNECAWFRIGPADGAVHSELHMPEGDRVFLNLFAGTKNNEEMGDGVPSGLVDWPGHPQRGSCPLDRARLG